MRDKYEIGNFSKGIITVADAIDIPDEACVYSENVDPSEGLLTPVKLSATPSGSTLPSNANKAAFAVKTATSLGLLYTCAESGNNKIKLIDGYTTAFTTAATELMSGATSESQSSMLIEKDKEIRIPRWSTWEPKMFKYYDFEQFGKKNISKPTAAETHTPNTKNKVYIKGICSGTSGNTYTVQAKAYGEVSYFDNTPSLGYVQFRFTNDESLKPTPDVAVDLILMTGTTIVQVIDGVDYTVTIRENSGGWNLVDFDNSTLALSGATLDTVTQIGFKMNDGTAPIMWRKNSGSWTVAAYTNSWTTLTDGLSLAVLDSADFIPGFILTYTCQNNYLFEDITQPVASLTNMTMTLAKTGSGTYFATGKKYFYKYSIVYDYFQETKLNTTAVTVNGAADEKVTVTFKIPNTDFTTFSRRVTGVNIYRGEASSTTAIVPEGYYRIINAFDLTEAYLTFDTTTGNIQLTYDDYGAWGASYESITGISEELTVLTPNYTYGAFSGNRLFTIANYLADEPEAGRMLLMSQPFKYDTFAWDTDQVLLSGSPKGIGVFRGKIFVFGDNVIWRINPDELYIEEVITGYNLLNQTTLLTTQYGLVFCTNTGAYIIDNTQVQEISYPIRNKSGVNSGISSAKCWTDLITSTVRLYSYYDEVKNSIIFMDTYTESAFVYYLPTKSWWYWAFDTGRTNASSTMIVDPAQNAYYTTGSTTKKLYAGNYAGLTWISKLITFNAVKQKKRLQKVKYLGDSGTAVSYAVDNSSSFTSISTQAGALTYAYIESLQVKITIATNATKYIFRAIEVLFRAMKGLR